MPEIKHNFSGAKMNKDVDERIVPNGQYRDALNVQVVTTDSDSSGIGDAGTLQNIKVLQTKVMTPLTILLPLQFR